MVYKFLTELFNIINIFRRALMLQREIIEYFQGCLFMKA